MNNSYRRLKYTSDWLMYEFNFKVACSQNCLLAIVSIPYIFHIWVNYIQCIFWMLRMYLLYFSQWYRNIWQILCLGQHVHLQMVALPLPLRPALLFLVLMSVTLTTSAFPRPQLRSLQRYNCSLYYYWFCCYSSYRTAIYPFGENSPNFACMTSL